MSIMECVVSNVAIATALAFVAALVGRVTAKPQVTHTLWLLVLVKLVTPPLVHIPVSYPFSEAVALESRADSAMNGVPDLASATKEQPPERAAQDDKGIALAEAPIPASTPLQEADVSHGIRSAPAVPWLNLLVGVWGTGSLIWFWLAGTRLWRFRKVLRYAHPAAEGIQTEVSDIASKYGLWTIPGVFVAEAKIPPLIWGFCGRNSMVLPSDLLDSLGADERAGLLAHELAHLKRCDHWIRWLEFSVLGVYWWNPVAWWARSEMQQAEEKCCDAWVLWVFPDKARQYAQALVNTVDFLACSPERTPDISTTFCQRHSLKRRIEMIVNNTVARRLSWKMRTVLALIALVVASVSVLAQGGDGSETGGSPLPDLKAKKNLGRMVMALELQRIHWEIFEDQGSGQQPNRKLDFIRELAPSFIPDTLSNTWTARFIAGSPGIPYLKGKIADEWESAAIAAMEEVTGEFCQDYPDGTWRFIATVPTQTTCVICHTEATAPKVAFAVPNETDVLCYASISFVEKN